MTVIRWWTTMFNLDTYIHIVRHVLIVVFVEDLPSWWNSTYSTSLIVPVFMRFQLSWFDSSVCQIYSAIMEILIHCISPSWRFYLLYIVHGNDHTCHILYIMPIHGHCTLMYPGLLYVFVVICRDWLLYYTDGWLFLPTGSSSLRLWDGFYNVFRSSCYPSDLTH